MKSIEKLLIFLGFLLFLATGYWIFFHGNDDLDSDQTPIALVEEVIGEAKKKSFEAIGWKMLQEGDKLFAKDRIFTLDESSMRIRFGDGTILNLTPNTLLFMVQENENLDIDLQKGFLGLKLTDIKNKVMIKLGSKKVGLNSPDAKLHLAYSEDSKTDMTVVSGVANVTFKDENIQLKKGEKISLDEQTVKIEVTKFGIEPLRPEGDDIYFSEEKKSVELAWDTKDPADEYKVLAARDPQFKNIIKSETTTKKNSSLEVKDEGHYYWKVKGMSGNKETSEAPISSFQVTKDIPPHQLFPASGAVLLLSAKQERRSVTLRWDGKKSEKYQLEIITEGAGKGEVFELDNEFYEWPDLLPLEYKWRVRNLDKIRPNSPWSDYRTFAIRQQAIEGGPDGPAGPKRFREYYDEKKGEWVNK